MVTWTAVDDANNSSSCTFKVNVLPNEAPCIGCDSTAVDPTDPTAGISCNSITSNTGTISVLAPIGTTTYTHSDDSWDVTVTDNGGHTTLTCALSGATTATGLTTLNGQIFNIGTTRVTWTATDDAGNPASCYFDVLVKDNNPVTVTIKENGVESTYDGYLQRVHGYTVQSISNSDYTVNDFAYVGPEEDTVITGRYVGDYPMNLKPEDFQNNNALFANVQFVIADSILKIKPNPNVITITAGSAQKPYDGVELTCENYTYTQGVLAMGDTLIAVTSGSRLDYGTSPNTIDEYRVFRNESLDGSMLRSISAPSGYTKDVTNQYTFATTEDGILEITKNGNVEVTITGHTGQYMYDGTTVYTVHGYDVSIVDTLNRYAVTDFVFNGDSVLQDMNQGYYEMDMVQSDFVNNNENYGPVTFHIVQGWMKIHGELKVTPVVSVSSVCAGINNGAATIGITGGVPNYTYQITGANTGYSNSGTTSGNISLTDLAADQYTVSVVDAAPFTANASFTIQEIPSILTPGNFEFECPAAITETLNYNECQMTINIGTPTFVNHMTDMEVTITNNAPEGNVFPQGTTEVVWTATDECGASLTCTQTIVVNYPPCGTAADSVADYDGIKYSSVRIGCQCWIGENLRSMHYSDGTPIADYRNYQDDPAKDTVFGKLYSWYSANRVAEDDDDTPVPTVTGPNGPYVQGACPDDWALPSDEDYRTLFETAGLVDYLKDPNPAYWLPGFAGIAPGTGFDARGAGWYDSDINRYMNLLGETYYWTSEPVTHVVNGHCAVITYYCPDGIIKDQKKGSGLSIRCIKMK